MIATIRFMPQFIERAFVGGREVYVIPNETTVGENFAERWTTEPARAAAFYQWHERVLEDFEHIAVVDGLDRTTRALQHSFGNDVVRKVMDARTEAISQARGSRQLYVAPAVGLSLSDRPQATHVRANTHFGE